MKNVVENDVLASKKSVVESGIASKQQKQLTLHRNALEGIGRGADVHFFHKLSCDRNYASYTIFFFIYNILCLFVCLRCSFHRIIHIIHNLFLHLFIHSFLSFSNYCALYVAMHDEPGNAFQMCFLYYILRQN